MLGETVAKCTLSFRLPISLSLSYSLFLVLSLSFLLSHSLTPSVSFSLSLSSRCERTPTQPHYFLFFLVSLLLFLF